MDATRSGERFAPSGVSAAKPLRRKGTKLGALFMPRMSSERGSPGSMPAYLGLGFPIL